ncbi:Glu-tRNA(Gln) amidotransferase subunit GatE [Candidatus Woesearchaeota archaeon]|nr:Glu-tRNA(Gln) amidotransferase subunit GatE [Candidatus Woesearchaeota archaeon]MBT4111192.1 Glu-tRNA(Gln) amidotransferase subunit GatE [Candidatus Woesearchaeota archaeon]MBT4336772.1 Glu-tRNA(Gln) amidotransferase subunit GatE [Candidatus Woesearchaeota archaeon]MBT4469440.1 Glu-tRNA(Gln) amidotransferase subunit GatE [Candidatus Woesearchaeota archaeon]MBT6744165.1 Glu-tRNA(Gln) amidotransferase subunit GatE [Candidatus Woesearchaeota archaeon]
MNMDYEKIGLKSGIEIHQQLEGKKLFCNCPTLLRDDKPDFEIRRKLRASAGESGKIDVAAKQEQIRNKTFIYQGYHDTTCLVECDEEPPHAMNQDALYTCLQLSKSVNANVSPVVQVMRKTVADGSNTGGFQRTALIARNGEIETSEGIVRIDNISLEEDACKIVSETETEKTYKLDRLGIPLIEIGTAPDIKTPQQCQETAKKLGMLLRSLPRVKRGLGTIRQDVNVSIKGGTRVEVKGAQDLRAIPTLVDLEIKRQMELLNIKKDLSGIKLNEFKIYDITKLLQKSKAKVIESAIKVKGKILALRLNEFSGIIGKELQPNYRVGSEFSGRAKIKAGVKGIFHSDELPNYGITKDEVDLIKKELKCKEKDAFVLVAALEDKAKIALSAVYERAEELFTGVPKEVRKAEQNGLSSFMRPMPGSARMYPETDVPLARPDPHSVELPELISERAERYQKKFSLNSDMANHVAKSNYSELFEELVKKYPKFKPAFIVDTLISMPIEIKKKYQLDSSKLTDENYKDLFKYLHSEEIHKDIVVDVLIDMIKGKFDLKNYESLSTEDVHETIKKIVSKNKGAPFGALMGQCMKALAGKVSGKVISEALRKEISGAQK